MDAVVVVTVVVVAVVIIVSSDVFSLFSWLSLVAVHVVRLAVVAVWFLLFLTLMLFEVPYSRTEYMPEGAPRQRECMKAQSARPQEPLTTNVPQSHRMDA